MPVEIKKVIETYTKCKRCHDSTPDIFDKCLNQEWYAGKPECYHDEKIKKGN